MDNNHLLKYKNPLLLKDDEGKVKPSTYDLPSGSHTYGKKIIDDPQPMKQVVNSWKEAQNSMKPPSKNKNYQQLNRQSVKNQFLTAKDQKQFRKTKDIMVEVREGQKVIPIMLPDEEYSYGVPNRPSTPMKLVMGNCYALEAELHNDQDYMQETQKMCTKGGKLQAKKTKSQALREQQAKKQKQFKSKPNIEDQFKLTKFTNIKDSKIHTGLKAKS